MSFSKLRERKKARGAGGGEQWTAAKKYCLGHSQQEQKGSESTAHQTPPYKHFACVVDGKEGKIFGFLINLLTK
jgi:hypothetical protein